MTTSSRQILRWSLLALACRLPTGCSVSPEVRPLRLAFITCAVDAPFFVPIKKGMHDAARAMGVESDFMGTPDVDVEAQAAMVRQAVEQGYDGIALNLIDPEAFDDVVREAIEAGVPVVGFNVDDHATPNARLASVNQRLYEAGRTLGEHLAPAIAEGSHVLATLHDEGVSALEDRLRGEKDGLRSRGVRWTVLVTGNDSGAGAERIAAALRENPDVRIVLGTGQSDTEAAGRAIEAHFSEEGHWSAGFDLSPTILRLIRRGVIRCTIDQQPYVQGFYPVVQLTLYLRHGLRPSSVDAGAAIIDRSSVDRVLELTEEGYR